MKIVNSVGKYNTSFGIAFIIKYETDIYVGQSIIIDNTEYIVKKIQMQTSPSEVDLITVFV